MLTNPQEDKPTGRYYCDPCLESTVEVQLKLAGKNYYDFIEPYEETETEVPTYKEPEEENEYF